MTTRSALVTGGSRGIGLGIAKRFLTDGYRVVINGLRDHDAVSETLEELSHLGGITYVAADVGTAEGRGHLVAKALTAVGRLDVLVNNAGITSPGRKDILEATEEDLDTVLSVNLKGPFLLTQIVARHMIEEGASDPEFRGRIINITSISAALASPNRSEYCISKAGLSMTTSLWATRPRRLRHRRLRSASRRHPDGHDGSRCREVRGADQGRPYPGTAIRHARRRGGGGRSSGRRRHSLLDRTDPHRRRRLDRRTALTQVGCSSAHDSPVDPPRKPA